ncbi:MAG: MarR family transcriptional regulator [Proteobacteria bacterium]|nr:MarR family transcriptional regulator [Pseudomonadota bacterium]
MVDDVKRAIDATGAGAFDGQAQGPSTLDPEGETLRDSIQWIIWYLRRLVQAGDVYSKELNRNFQVSQPQLSCLLALDQYGPMSSSALAKYILVKPSTITGIVDRLEQKGLVTRQRNTNDRRVVTIELTEPGRQLARDAPPPIPEVIIHGLKKLPPETTQKIVEYLGTLVSLLDEVPADIDIQTAE